MITFIILILSTATKFSHYFKKRIIRLSKSGDYVWSKLSYLTTESQFWKIAPSSKFNVFLKVIFAKFDLA
jgi:hypothetical protein